MLPKFRMPMGDTEYKMSSREPNTTEPESGRMTAAPNTGPPER